MAESVKQASDIRWRPTERGGDVAKTFIHTPVHAGKEYVVHMLMDAHDRVIEWLCAFPDGETFTEADALYAFLEFEDYSDFLFAYKMVESSSYYGAY